MKEEYFARLELNLRIRGEDKSEAGSEVYKLQADINDLLGKHPGVVKLAGTVMKFPVAAPPEAAGDQTHPQTPAEDAHTAHQPGQPPSTSTPGPSGAGTPGKQPGPEGPVPAGTSG